MELKQFIQSFADTTKKNIIELAKTDLNNGNKKMTLDHKIINFLEDSLEKLELNFILKIALKKLLIPNISLITQIIFDLLKERIKGLSN